MKMSKAEKIKTLHQIVKEHGPKIRRQRRLIELAKTAPGASYNADLLDLMDMEHRESESLIEMSNEMLKLMDEIDELANDANG
jgi:hypothetical protein